MQEQRLSSWFHQWFGTGSKPEKKDGYLENGNTKAQDLTFVSTADMLAELNKRHDALIILGMRFEEKERYTIIRHQQGHRYVLLGMLSNMADLINKIENEHLKYRAEDNV